MWRGRGIGPRLRLGDDEAAIAKDVRKSMPCGRNADAETNGIEALAAQRGGWLSLLCGMRGCARLRLSGSKGAAEQKSRRESQGRSHGCAYLRPASGAGCDSPGGRLAVPCELSRGRW